MSQLFEQKNYILNSLTKITIWLRSISFLSYFSLAAQNQRNALDLILTILTRSKAHKIKILRDKLSELSCEIDKADISKVIVHNIREFMTHKKKGRDNLSSMQAKQAIVIACTYTGSGSTVDLDRI